MPPHTARPAPELDDAFVLIVSFAVVAGLTFFVVVQAIGVLREMMDRECVLFFSFRLFALPFHSTHWAISTIDHYPAHVFLSRPN
jgi:hypothetical protein